MARYTIIPGCSDLNRGDQALVWETKRLAEDCGFVGDYYLTTEKNEPVEQSRNIGFKIVSPILEHPSRKFKRKNNIKYTPILKLKWGAVALIDFIRSLLILWKPTRKLVKFFSNPCKKDAIEAIEKADAIFMKGGGVLQTYGGLTSTYSMYYWVFPLLLANRLKIPVYIMPNSFGPFQGPFVKQIAKSALKKSKLLSTRETLSQDMVKSQLGLDATTYPDLAFYLEKAPLDREQFFERFNIPKDKKLVAVTMRPYRFPGSADPNAALNTFKSELADFICWLYNIGYMPVIVEHTRAINDHENDGACIKSVTALLKKDTYRIVSNENFNCRDLKCIYGFCDYIVGTRFHSMIFSFGNNVPGIAIAYTGNKSQGIMHDIGLDDYVVNIANVRSDILKKKFIMLVDNEEAIIRKICTYRQDAEQKRHQLVSKCKKQA